MPPPPTKKKNPWTPMYALADRSWRPAPTSRSLLTHTSQTCYRHYHCRAAGCIAGGIEATAVRDFSICHNSSVSSRLRPFPDQVWPMEFIKTQLQLQSKVKGQLPYNGMLSGLSYYVRTTGFLSLYNGLAPTLVGSMPKAGIRFGLNALIKDNLRDKDGKLTPGKNFVAGELLGPPDGHCGGVAQQLVSSPQVLGREFLRR